MPMCPPSAACVGTLRATRACGLGLGLVAGRRGVLVPSSFISRRGDDERPPVVRLTRRFNATATGQARQTQQAGDDVHRNTTVRPGDGTEDTRRGPRNEEGAGTKGAVELTFKGTRVGTARVGAKLRTALLRRGVTPHNGGAKVINCRGLGTVGLVARGGQHSPCVSSKTHAVFSTRSFINASSFEYRGVACGWSYRRCGTCAVEVIPANGVEPRNWTAMERARLNFPPHASPGNAQLRLACQVRIAGGSDELEVVKRSKFWGQGKEVLSEEIETGARRDVTPFGALEFVLDEDEWREGGTLNVGDVGNDDSD